MGRLMKPILLLMLAATLVYVVVAVPSPKKKSNSYWKPSSNHGDDDDDDDNNKGDRPNKFWDGGWSAWANKNADAGGSQVPGMLDMQKGPPGMLPHLPKLKDFPGFDDDQKDLDKKNKKKPLPPGKPDDDDYMPPKPSKKKPDSEHDPDDRRDGQSNDWLRTIGRRDDTLSSKSPADSQSGLFSHLLTGPTSDQWSKFLAKDNKDGGGLQKVFKCHTNTFPPSTLPDAPANATQEYAGYAFVFFKDDTEQINAGISVGNNPLNYTFFNGGEPIFNSTVGSKHTRDPFLVRSPDKSRNWIIATDNSLKEFFGKGDKAQRYASRHITIYESVGASLVDWKPSRLSPELAGEWSGGVNAPEAIYDKSVGKYFVQFSSNSFAKEDTNHTGPIGNSSIYYTYTADFVNFDSPKLYYSIPGGGLVDMTFIELNGTGHYARFFRDDTNGVLKVRGQRTDGGLFGQWTDIGTDKDYISNDGANGGPLAFRDNMQKDLYHIWVDEFAGGYKLYETNDPESVPYRLSDAPSFPKDLKQGSVTPITAAEYNELRKWIDYKDA